MGLEADFVQLIVVSVSESVMAFWLQLSSGQIIPAIKLKFEWCCFSSVT